MSSAFPEIYLVRHGETAWSASGKHTGRTHIPLTAAGEEAARRINAPYAIDAEKTATGVRPAHIKDRIRGLGPTVRPDLTLKPGDPNAVREVI